MSLLKVLLDILDPLSTMFVYKQLCVCNIAVATMYSFTSQDATVSLLCM